MGTMLLISKVHLIFQRNKGKMSDLVQKDTGLLQVEFIVCEKKMCLTLKTLWFL